jgi:protease I
MKNIALFCEHLYEDLELWYPKLRLQEAGFRVTVVGTGESHYKSKHGYPVSADVQAANAAPSDYDGVIVPGGYAPDKMRAHEPMVRFVADLFRQGKLTASICHGLWVLASAGILKGRRCTCYHTIRDDVRNAGAAVVDEPVVVDGNLISSRQPEDLPAFMREVLKFLGRD